jgi:HlyD family secretion protein
MTAPGDPPLPLVDSGKATTAQNTPPTKPLWRSPERTAALAVAAMVLGTVLGAYLGPELQRGISHFSKPTGLATTSAGPVAVQAAAANAVAALGRLMPEGDTITLALPFGAGDARVASWLVREGQRVSAGQVIAELDNLPQRRALQATAAAQLTAKRAALDQARSEARLGWAEAHAAAKRAHAARLVANQNLARLQSLVPAGVTTQAQLEQARAVADQAAADHAQAAAAIQRYTHRDADAQSDVRLALGNLLVAQAALAQAEQDLASARVTAILDGTVLAVHVRVGEKPGDQGIATLGNVDRMAAELEVYQTDISRVALGQRVVLNSTSLAAPLSGVVVQIGMEVQRQAVLSSDPVSSTDARVVKVKVELDAASSERARALTGLQVAGKIAVGTP